VRRRRSRRQRWLTELGEHLGLWGERDVAVGNVRVNITVEDVLEAKRRVAECRRAIGAPPLLTDETNATNETNKTG
jgi:hypothetical protein